MIWDKVKSSTDTVAKFELTFKKAVDDGNTMSALFPDGTHPNVTGHDYMSDYIISLLEIKIMLFLLLFLMHCTTTTQF